jgi:hypothetical protein
MNSALDEFKPGKMDYSANSKSAMESLKRYDKQIDILE